MMKKSARLLQICFLLFVILSLVSCSNTSTSNNDIAIFMQAFDKHSPKPYSGTLLVYQSDEILFHQSFGYADVNNNDEITNNHLFPIGSITKTITATAIMILQEQGMIDLEDSINDVLEVDDFDESLRIKHLLSHTTQFSRDGLFKGLSSVSTQEHFDYLLNVSKNKKATQTLNYSNANYILLAIILEKITNQPYEQVIQEVIFDPLNMNHSYVVMDEKMLDNQVKGYQLYDNDASELTMYNLSNVLGSGNIIMSSEDLLTFIVSFKEKTLLSASSIQQMMTKQACNEIECYGYGWFVSPSNNLRVYHGGHINNSGYVSYVEVDQNKDTIVILLTNNEDMTAYEVVRQSVVALLDDQETVVLQKESKQNYSSNDIEAIVGKYSINQDVIIEVKVNDNVFYASAEDGKYYELIMLEENKFAYKEVPWVTLTFNDDTCIIQNIATVFEAQKVDE